MDSAIRDDRTDRRQVIKPRQYELFNLQRQIERSAFYLIVAVCLTFTGRIHIT